ncbi:GspH/FimT family pseudopilin [Roseateles chitinivorans]|uniref:GspH/FimT family pseudopilin n=1 Tax=Roseateles chitinivorans TaxID=2917965 RepID=UPI003D674F3C
MRPATFSFPFRVPCPGTAPHPALTTARGVSLIELLVSIALVALAALLAGPDLRDWLWRQRLANAAQAVLGDLQLARSEAILGARNVILRFGGDLSSLSGSGRCYVLHTGAPSAVTTATATTTTTTTSGNCDCRLDTPPLCDGGAQAIKQARWSGGRGQAEVVSNVPSMLFSGRQGTVSVSGTIEVRMTGIGTVRHIVSITGRVRSCTPDGALNRLPRCA